MAVKLFGTESSSYVSKDWLNDWVESNKSNCGKPYRIEKIVLSKKGNGYLLETEAFCHFIWKNNSTTKSFIEAVSFYAEKLEGPAFVVVPQRDGTGILGLDDEVSCFFSKRAGGYYISDFPQETEEEDFSSPLNPFLRAGDSLPPMETSTGSQKKRSKGPTASSKPSQTPSMGDLS